MTDKNKPLNYHTLTLGTFQGKIMDTKQTEALPAPGASITLDFRMATELLKMFGEEPGLITLQHGSERSHSGTGLYALYSHLPEEGAEFLGAEPDNKAMPKTAAAPAQAGEYPELPPLQVRYDGLGHTTTMGYGVSQMRDYADATCAARGVALVAPKHPKKDFSEVDSLLSWFNEKDGFSQGTRAPHKWVLQTHAELIRLRAALAAQKEAND